MQKESPSIQKTEWRRRLADLRKAIPSHRRKEASALCLEAFKSKGRILSFSPVGSELDVRPLNEYLRAKGLLLLVPYETALSFELPQLEVDLILVPGLGFDPENYRIGYGKGWYDRFLAGTKRVPTMGVGFKEQLCNELLPRDPWDIPLDQIALF